MEENKEIGYVWLPYITKTVRTDINGETVWYANKWKNLLLKIKHFFIKPKYLKNAHLYSKKTINDKFYQRIKIDKNDEYIGKERKEVLVKKWEESGVLDGITAMDKESPLLKLYEPTKEQKINEIPNIKEYEFWFKEKFGCLPFEKYHGVGPTNLEEALSLRRDFPNDLRYGVITFEEYKNLK